MKPIAPDELVELLSPEDAMVDVALRQFEFTAPVLFREPGCCRQLIAEGWTTASQINWQGRPAFVVTWHVTPDGGFWLDIAQTLGTRAPFAVLVAAMEQFAREKVCRYIRFLTLRRGLVTLAQQHGYAAEAVLLSKLL